jgi:hypothetical protein
MVPPCTELLDPYETGDGKARDYKGLRSGVSRGVVLKARKISRSARVTTRTPLVVTSSDDLVLSSAAGLDSGGYLV